MIFDRQYSPFLFTFDDEYVVPAESVYAVFEAKQSINATEVEYAKNKIKSVRSLTRTSLPIPYAKGTYPAKPPEHIYGGLLVLGSDWSPALGTSLTSNLATTDKLEQLDIGCVAEHGNFIIDDDSGNYSIEQSSKAATCLSL